MDFNNLNQVEYQMLNAISIGGVLGDKVCYYGQDPTKNNERFSMDNQQDFENYATVINGLGVHFKRTVKIGQDYLDYMKASDGILLVFEVGNRHLLDEELELPTSLAQVFRYDRAEMEVVFAKVVF